MSLSEIHIFIIFVLFVSLNQFSLLSPMGYESAVFWGIVLGVGTLCYVSIQWPKQRENNDIQTCVKLAKIPCESLILVTILYALQESFVSSCDTQIGFLFWLCIPCVSVFWGFSLGTCIAISAPSPSKIHPIWISLGLIGIELGWVLYRLALEPPIQFFEWFGGWFAGSIYDEAIAIPDALILSRIILILLGLALLIWSLHKKNTFRYVAVIPFVTAISLLFASAELHHDQHSVQKELGSSLESPHFIVYYSGSKSNSKEMNLFVKDAEFRYWQLQKFFEEDPVTWRGRKIEIFLYPDSHTQYRLMGSRNTMVARPWTHQMHIRWNGEGDSILTHELAHLFTAPFADHFMNVPIRYGLMLDLGLLEGIAAAAQWEIGDVDDHLVSATLMQEKKAPDLQNLFGPTGFWVQPSGKAYTLVGSFVRWLIDTYGITKMKEVYATGQYEQVYGIPVTDLLDQWKSFLNQEQQPTELQKQYILATYERPSIFQKTCPRFVAEQSRLANNNKGAQNYKKAIQHVQNIRSKIPKQPSWIFEESQLLLLDDRPSEALEKLQELDRSKLTTFQNNQLEELEADIFVYQKAFFTAKQNYEKIRTSTFPSSKKRTLIAKENNVEHEAIHQYISLPTKENLANLYLYDKKTPMMNYLVGIRLFYQHQWSSAESFLSQTLEYPEMEEQRLLLLLQTYRHLEEWETYNQVYDVLCQKKSSHRISMSCKEEQERQMFLLKGK